MSNISQVIDLEKEVKELGKKKAQLESDIETRLKDFEEKCLKREREIDQKSDNELQNLETIKKYNEGLFEEKSKELSRISEDIEKHKKEGALATAEIEELESVKKEISSLKKDLEEREKNLSEKLDKFEEREKTAEKKIEDTLLKYNDELKRLAVMEADFNRMIGDLSNIELEREAVNNERKKFDDHVASKQRSLDTLQAQCNEKIKEAEATKAEYEKLSIEVEKKNRKS